jgi:hypothetical protein
LISKGPGLEPTSNTSVKSTHRCHRIALRCREFLSSACRRSLLLIAVRRRKSAIRCFLLYLQRKPALPFPMVVPVSAQVSRLRPCPPPHYPPLTTHFLLVMCITWRQYLSRSQQLPHTSRRHGGVTLLRHSAYMSSPPLCPLCLRGKSHVFSGLQPLCRSLRSFRHALPLFSIACSLFSKNAGGGWGISVQFSRGHCFTGEVSETEN